MKRIEIDCNFNYLGPGYPALSEREVESLNLHENDSVTVYQDGGEWSGILCFDDSLPFQYQWYVKI